MAFTIEDLISGTRRSPAVPNDAGTHLLFTSSSYSIGTNTETHEVKVIDVATKQESLFTDNPKYESVQWTTGTQVLWFVTKDDKTEVWTGSAVGEKKPIHIGTIPTAISHAQAHVVSPSKIILGYTSSTGKPAPSNSSGREYETALVRFWDTYHTSERFSLFVVDIVDNKLGTPIDVLKDTSVRFPLMPSSSLDDSGAYTLSDNGVLISTWSPEHNPAIRLSVDLYYVPYGKKPIQIKVPGFEGNAYGAAFSPDKKSAAFAVDKDWEKGDVTSIFTVSLDTLEPKEIEIYNKQGKFWDRQPTSIVWADNSLYVTAKDQARNKLYSVPIASKALATEVVSSGTVSSVYYRGSRIFYTKNSITEPSIFATLEETISAQPSIPTQVEEFYVSVKDRKTQSWLLKPSDFDPKKTYPVALIVHGGPKSDNPDGWSSRWNPALYAEQGYIVIEPNPSGSVGWGADLCDAVRGSWGGNPYDDIVAVWDYVKTLDYVDTSRAVALGASYGGYMMYWLAGQPLAKEFKAIVTHDGVWSMMGMLGCDYPTSLKEDLGEFLWDKQQLWDKWDPARYTHNWTTPMLIIHSDLDYRCPIVDGLAAYTVCLQRGVPARLLNFPDENHWVLKRANSLHWHRTVFGWINKYAGVKGVELQPPVSENP